MLKSDLPSSAYFQHTTDKKNDTYFSHHITGTFTVIHHLYISSLLCEYCWGSKLNLSFFIGNSRFNILFVGLLFLYVEINNSTRNQSLIDYNSM